MVRQSLRALVSRLFASSGSGSSRRVRRANARRNFPRAEVLEVRSLLTASVLSTETMFFDPTPALPTSGDEVAVGSIEYLRDGNTVSVRASIDANRRLRYSMESISVASTELGSLTQSLAERTQDVTVTLPTPAAARSSFSLSTSVSVVGTNTELFNAALPTLAGLQSYAGSIVQPLNLTDGVVNPGYLPAVGGTDVNADTVEFVTDPGWRTGEAVKVMASLGAPTTGLVVAPTTTDNATNALVYVQRLTATKYSFHTTQANAMANTAPIDILTSVPTDGSLLFTGAESDLSFLAQTPKSTLAVPASTNLTNESVTFAVAPCWQTGDAVRVTTTGGGLTAGTEYFVRVSGTEYSFYLSEAAAVGVAVSSTLPVNLTSSLTSGIYLSRRLVFAEPHRWTTGTSVRMLGSSTATFVRVVNATSVTLHSTLADASAGTAPNVQGSNPATPIAPVFNMFCVDRDRMIVTGRQYTSRVFSSYSIDQFPDTTLPPKDAFAVQDQNLAPNSVLTISSGNISTGVFTSSAHGLPTGTLVRLTAASVGLSQAVDYYVRSLTSNTFSLHASAADAVANTGVIKPTATSGFSMYPTWAVKMQATSASATAGDVGRPGIALPTGSRVQITMATGGLQTNTNYFVRFQSNQLFSLHNSRADAVSGDNPIRITSGLDSTARFFVPERIVEWTENLDAVNWLLNQPILDTLSAPMTPSAFTATTLTIPAHSFTSGDRFRVTAPTGDLVPGQDYFYRKIDANTLSVYATRAEATAGTTIANTPLTLVDASGNLAAQIQSYFVWYDVEESVWSLIDNYSAGYGYGNGGNLSGIDRVSQILSTVGANVPLFDASVDFVPGRGQSVVLITMPYEATATGEWAVSAQTLAFLVPVDTIQGYIVSTFSTDDYTFTPPSTLGGRVFKECDNDGVFNGQNTGLKDVTVTLTGTDFLGQTVSLVTTTGTDGTYLFTDLMPGTYTVTESQPAEYLDGLDSAGSQGGQVNNDVVSAINLPEGVDATGYDFAEIGPSSLCGTAYVDTDNDGKIDATETGLLGVIITLVGTDDLGQAVSVSTTTDANGHYHFDGLRPGSYTLAQTQPSGYLDGKDSVGEAGGTVGNDSFTVTLGACTDACEYNFGELLSSSLSGRVFKECDNDGVFNGLNVGLVGVTVTLTGIDDLGQSVSVSTTTDLDGRYGFLNLRPGTYSVTETQPADYLDGIDTAGSAGGSVANDAISSISLGSEIDATGYDFAELGPSSLCGTVYADLNNNGALDGDEALLAGVVIDLTGTDDRGQSVSLTATTNENGHYEFEGLRPGTYTLTQTQPSGYLDGQDSLGEAGGTLGSDSFTVTLDACTHACDYNFGELPPSSLAGQVFKECDNDGVFNGQNQPLSGVTVTLSGEDDLGNTVSLTATTDTDGRYRFLNLRPGTYTVTESQPATYLDGIDTVGSAGGTLANDVISAISLGIGVDGTDYNFAEIGPSSICGTVYVDANDDGVHDTGESGLAGVLITLVGTDDRGQSVSLTTTTDTNGHYHFEGLRPGTYSVFEAQPSGYVDGKETVGTAGGAVGADSFTITLGACDDSCGYNFGELSVSDLLAVGDTATIGFWANKNGQAILRNLNGGASSTLLAQWLVTNFPNLYGASADSRSLLTSSGAYQTNDQVATTYINAFFKPKATVKLEAQILAAAFATYVTNSGLAGSSNIATRYGFNVSSTGTGGKLFSVGSSGAALGVADGTQLTIFQMLVLANSFAVNGTLYAGNTTLRTKANVLFTAINETGDII